MDSLILCKFLRGVFRDFAAEAAIMLSLVTGWDVTADELKLTAQRIVTAKKIFNIQAGWQPDEDTLPKRMLNEPLADDDTARLSEETLRELIAVYNYGRRWSRDGHPTDTELERLGLDPTARNTV
jgi:aldehyde:ferredoxin oxidoreductase